jgi:DNA ligase (NAD+)|nr:MAG TPA: DNA ligase [Caudoviricetes sp.]
MNIQDEILSLKKTIQELDHHYYQKSHPLTTDLEYDQLVQRLKYLESLTYTDQDSPTKTITDTKDPSFKEIKHLTPMLSLSNVFVPSQGNVFIPSTGDKDYLAKFLASLQEHVDIANIDFSIEEKFDGLACNLIYEKGVLVSAATRGDGSIGEDVLKNVLVIEDIPDKIVPWMEIPEVIEIRGEVYVRRSVFDRLNEKHKSFSNCRNLASGSLRVKDPKITKERQLSFFSYGVGYHSGAIPDSYTEVLSWLNELGFKTSPLQRRCKIDDLYRCVDEIGRQRDELDYDIDGCVIKVDSLALQERLGYKHRDPYWAIAVKYPSQEVISQIKDIQIFVGRTGVITPVAVIDEVEIGGARVSNVSLANFDLIEVKDIRIGDYVFVRRSGEVIPQITEVILGKRDPSLVKYITPERCPCCQTVLVKDGSYLKCINRRCLDVVKAKMGYLVSKEVLDIDGLGESTIDMLVYLDYLKEPSDLYFLDEFRLTQVTNSDKLTKKILKNIQDKQTLSLQKVLLTLMIDNCGPSICKLLSSRYSLDDLRSVGVEDLTKIPGIGEVLAGNIYQYFHDEDNLKSLDRLLSVIHIQKDILVDDAFLLKGKHLCITGSFSVSRSQLKDYLEQRGCIVVNSVSKHTDYLLCGEGDQGGKYQKAMKLKTPLIHEQDFAQYGILI